MKMLSCQYRDSHYKYKTVSQLPCLYNGNPHTWERQSWNWDTALESQHLRACESKALAALTSDKTSYHKISENLEAAEFELSIAW